VVVVVAVILEVVFVSGGVSRDVGSFVVVVVVVRRSVVVVVVAVVE
jgi:hypothetical protein